MWNRIKTFIAGLHNSDSKKSVTEIKAQHPPLVYLIRTCDAISIFHAVFSSIVGLKSEKKNLLWNKLEKISTDAIKCK